jgi:ribosomal protein S12 methylthiotransferase accessory factor
MKIETRYPGGVRVDAVVRGFTVPTDQPFEVGGYDTAPSPYELFAASLATCGGFYAVLFCRKRHIPTEGLGLTVEATRDPETRLFDTIRMDLELPHDFPEKYREAIVRAIDQCAVKRAFDSPPRVEIEVVESVAAD